jgi:hypothetical protein
MPVEPTNDRANQVNQFRALASLADDLLASSTVCRQFLPALSMVLRKSLIRSARLKKNIGSILTLVPTEKLTALLEKFI